MPVKAHGVSLAGSHRRTVLLRIRKPRDLSAAKASANSGHLSKITFVRSVGAKILVKE